MCGAPPFLVMSCFQVWWFYGSRVVVTSRVKYCVRIVAGKKNVGSMVVSLCLACPVDVLLVRPVVVKLVVKGHRDPGWRSWTPNPVRQLMSCLLVRL